MVPVDGAIAVQHLRQFLRHRQKFLVAERAFHALRLAQRIVERLFLVIQPKLIAFLLLGFDLLSHLQQLLNHLLVGEQPFQVIAQCHAQHVAEFLALHHIHAVRAQFLFQQFGEQFHRQVFLLHVANFSHESLVEKRKVGFVVGKQIDNSFALHALTQQRANAVVDFRFRHFRPAAVEFCQEHTHRVEQRHFQFLLIGEQ